ncbi:MAG: manganese efflux pump [Clostridia bacterium]|nr:manganese efflux pump [Clostridia bacterium]
MDAFAVSVCKGLAVKDVTLNHLALAGTWFGSFQALMPLIGYFLGSSFHSYIESFDHWIAFALLLFIGANMLKEAFSEDSGKPADASFGVKTMLLMAIATSVDALAAGIALAMDENGNIWISVLIIGAVTFILSAAGIKIGSLFGERYQKKARIAGGVILILIGLKVLIEHLF